MVRTARGDELDAAGAVVVAAYRADGLAAAEEDYLAVVADAASRAADGEVLVAVDGAGRVLGSVTYAVHGSRLAELSRPGEAEFRMLGVSPYARGRGVGRALVVACLDRARRDGARRLVLSTEPVSTTAHRLYAALGFRREPGLDWTPVPHIHLVAYVLDVDGT